VKGLARLLAAVLVSPVVLSTVLRGAAIGRDRAFQHTMEWMAQVPGLPGQYLRRAYLAALCVGCGPEVVVGAGTLCSTVAMRLDDNAYVGPLCTIGWVHLERDVMIAAGVRIPSGPDVHGSTRTDIPMRDQPGSPVCVHVREGAWIGDNAVVMADVGRHAIVAAGAVVTSPVPDYAVVAGVPARVVRDRREAPAAAGPVA
jgi:acetyltransferase-like isoleucine patch superfamily enzyme